VLAGVVVLITAGWSLISQLMVPVGRERVCEETREVCEGSRPSRLELAAI